MDGWRALKLFGWFSKVGNPCLNRSIVNLNILLPILEVLSCDGTRTCDDSVWAHRPILQDLIDFWYLIDLGNMLLLCLFKEAFSLL